MRLYREQMHPKHHIKRAYQHRWQDGIFEILIGIGLMLYALFLTVRIEPAVSEVLQIVIEVLTAAIVVFFGIVAFRFISERMKENLAYPRTGLVTLNLQRQNLSARTIILTILAMPVFAVIGLVVSLGVLYLFARLNINGSLLILSAMVAFPAVILARRTGLTRLYWLAGGILLIGGLLTITDTFCTVGLALLYGFTGVLVSLSGGIAFVIHLRQHPLHVDGEAADGNL